MDLGKTLPDQADEKKLIYGWSFKNEKNYRCINSKPRNKNT